MSTPEYAEDADVTGAEAPRRPRRPTDAGNPYILRLIDGLHEDIREQTAAIGKLADTLREDNAAMRDAVTNALTASSNRFEAHSTRLDKTVRWVVGGSLVVVIVCLVALGAVVDSRISVSAGSLSVGANVAEVPATLEEAAITVEDLSPPASPVDTPPLTE